MRLRGPRLEHFTLEVQLIARPHRMWPAKLIEADRDDSARRLHVALDQESMVTAAVCQPLAAKP